MENRETEQSVQPFERKAHHAHKLQPTEAYFEFVKSNLGIGAIVLPFVTQQVGWLWSIFLFIPVAFCGMKSSLLLIEVADHLEVNHIFYADVIRITLGHKWSIFLDFAIIAQLIGICIAYLIFLTNSITQSFQALGFNFQKWESLLITLIVVFPLSYVKRIRFFHLTSKYGFYAAVLGFVLVLYDCYFKFQEGQYDFGNKMNFKQSFNYVGVAILCCEGIFTVLPIRDSMQNKFDFKYVAFSSMLTAFGISLLIAVTSVPIYQDEIKPILLFNIKNSYIQLIAIISYSFSILVTYPLQLFPAVQIIERMYQKNGPYNQIEIEQQQQQHNENEKIFTHDKTEIIIRSLIMINLYLLAYYVPHLQHFINLMGSILGSLLQYVFPVLAHMIHFKITSYHQPKKTYCLILFVSILAFILGTLESSKGMM